MNVYKFYMLYYYTTMTQFVIYNNQIHVLSFYIYFVRNTHLLHRRNIICRTEDTWLSQNRRYILLVEAILYFFSITFIITHCIFIHSIETIFLSLDVFTRFFTDFRTRVFKPFWFNEKFCSQEIQFVADCKLKREHTETELTESWVPGPKHSGGGGKLSSAQWLKFG